MVNYQIFSITSKVNIQFIFNTFVQYIFKLI